MSPLAVSRSSLQAPRTQQGDSAYVTVSNNLRD
jgi:hypothetical protein